MTFTNGKATVSYTIHDGKPYVHSLDGEGFAMREVVRDLEKHLSESGFTSYYVAKDILKEKDEIERLMGRHGLMARFVIFEKVLSNGDRSRHSGDGGSGREFHAGERPGERGELTGETQQESPSVTGD